MDKDIVRMLGSGCHTPGLVTFREPAGNFSDESVNAVKSVTRQEHKRAFSRHKLDSVLPAEFHCLGTDGAVSGRTVHPYPANACLGAIDDYGFRNRRGRH